MALGQFHLGLGVSDQLLPLGHISRCTDSSCLFCVLTLLHDPATCLLAVSVKGWRAAAGALRGEELGTCIRGSKVSTISVDNRPYLPCHSILRSSTSAGILLPSPDVSRSRKAVEILQPQPFSFCLAWLKASRNNNAEL